MYTFDAFSNYVSIVDCGIPVPPFNGHLGGYPNSKENTTVTFQCDEDYVPSLVRTSTCTGYGVWEPNPAEHNCSLIEGNVCSPANLLYIYIRLITRVSVRYGE